MIDPLNPYAEDHPKSPGEQAFELATELASIVESVGGPKLNENALATLIVDLRTWWKHLG